MTTRRGFAVRVFLLLNFTVLTLMAQPMPQSPPAGARPAISPTIEVTANSFFIRSPYQGMSQNKRLVEALRLRLVLARGYRDAGSTDVAAKLGPGMEAASLLQKTGPGGVPLWIAIGISRDPDGGYELVGTAWSHDTPGQQPNPEFPELASFLHQQVLHFAEQPQALDLRQMAYEEYKLSYVDADRAMGLLKSLGYTTVEYRPEAGESVSQKIYSPVQQGATAPIVVKLIDATKTSLLDAPPQPTGQSPYPSSAYPTTSTQNASTVPDIGGTYLHQATAGEPQQRLLIFYDKEDPQSLQKLMELLHDTVDVPSRQVVIEALVIEVHADRSRDLGLTFTTTQGHYGGQFGQTDANGNQLPFIFDFNRDKAQIATFRAQLQALITRGDAELLSNPSVLVLDGRQARVQIGQQVPVIKSTATNAGIVSSVDYFPVGIVLNLRPRVSEDATECSMQVETIVSSVNQLASSEVAAVSKVFLAPVVDNRQVQSFIRVSDNTPFIIGGLISTDEQRNIFGIPILSEIPGIGAAFRHTTYTKTKSEVIIVVTPHVVPLDDKYVRYVMAKDSPLFERFGDRLFRDTYRVRAEDLFDTESVFESKAVKDLQERVTRVAAGDPELEKQEPFASIRKGGVPGEDILVRRMLWEIIQKTGYAKFVDLDHINFLEQRADAPDGSGFQATTLKSRLAELGKGQNTLELSFDDVSQPGRPLNPPKAAVSFANLSAGEYAMRLAQGNAAGATRHGAILLNDGSIPEDVSSFDALRGVLVLERILDLNTTLPLTVRDFHVGREIVFPSEDDLRNRNFMIDRKTAQLFWEVRDYYPAFEQQFDRESKRLTLMLDRLEKTSH